MLKQKLKYNIGDRVRIVRAPYSYTLAPGDDGVVSGWRERDNMLKIVNPDLWGKKEVYIPQCDVEPISAPLREENLEAKLERLREVAEIGCTHAQCAQAEAEENDRVWQEAYDRLEDLRKSKQIKARDNSEYAGMSDAYLVQLFHAGTLSDMAKEICRRLIAKGENK